LTARSGPSDPNTVLASGSNTVELTVVNASGM
jgi:hypothetical protein